MIQCRSSILKSYVYFVVSLVLSSLMKDIQTVLRRSQEFYVELQTEEKAKKELTEKVSRKCC